MTGRENLILELVTYNSDYPEEMDYRDRFLKLLEHPRSFFRDHFPGHITGSGWVVDPVAQQVLLLHHTKLDKWLQPGGHADGDEHVRAVAQREVFEETGLHELATRTEIFDIDIHTIPARGNEPEHEHFDIRYLLLADSSLPIKRNEESNDVKWIPLAELSNYTGSYSIFRMAEKTRKSF